MEETGETPVAGRRPMPVRPARAARRTGLVALLAAVLLAAAGCTGGLTESFKQSLSVTTPAKINFSELEYYAKRSNSAYDEIEVIQRDYPRTTRAVTVPSVDIRYFIETDTAAREQTLSIRGTAERPNVWEDIEVALVRDSRLGIRLHRGFQRDATAIYADATPYLRKDYALRITGHSLGGAVAAILAEYYAKDGYRVERVVTFGQPRVSTQKTSQDLDGLLARTTRVVNELDVVPMVPPYSVIRNYQHFPPEVILLEGPDYVYLPQHDADRLSISDFWRNAGTLSAEDHHIDGYLANIRGKVAKGSRQVPYRFDQ